MPATGNPHWFYLKDSAWEQIPDDIIHWNEFRAHNATLNAGGADSASDS